jgi:hypothetical protein
MQNVLWIFGGLHDPIGRDAALPIAQLFECCLDGRGSS